MSNELKPCPFCGEALTVNNANLAAHPRYSECLFAQHVVVMDDPAQLRKWNRRAQPAPPVTTQEPNQCDGCQAGVPLVNGAHRMGKPRGYPDTMSCQAGKYASAEPSAPVDERDQRADIDCDAAYRNGVMHGYKLGMEADEAEYQACVNGLTRHLCEARAKLNRGAQ